MNHSQTISGPGDKAEAILEGAMQEFLVHGYAATSMDRVAKTAKVSKATVYSYFQDKESLFTALVQRLAQQRFPKVFGSDPVWFEGEDAAGVLHRFATNALTRAMNDPEYTAFIRLIIGESGRFPELARIFVLHLAKPATDTLSQYLAHCPKLNLADPEATARIILGTLIHYVIVEEMLQGGDLMPMERDRLIENLVHLVLAANRDRESEG